MRATLVKSVLINSVGVVRLILVPVALSLLTAMQPVVSANALKTLTFAITQAKHVQMVNANAEIRKLVLATIKPLIVMLLAVYASARKL